MASGSFDGNSSQEYPVNYSRLHSWLHTYSTIINDLLDDVICNIVIYADDTTLFFICDKVPALWQQLELPSELESDL